MAPTKQMPCTYQPLTSNSGSILIKGARLTDTFISSHKQHGKWRYVNIKVWRVKKGTGYGYSSGHEEDCIHKRIKAVTSEKEVPKDILTQILQMSGGCG